MFEIHNPGIALTRITPKSAWRVPNWHVSARMRMHARARNHWRIFPGIALTRITPKSANGPFPCRIANVRFSLLHTVSLETNRP
jgi:hypothetical protein